MTSSHNVSESGRQQDASYLHKQPVKKKIYSVHIEHNVKIPINKIKSLESCYYGKQTTKPK